MDVERKRRGRQYGQIGRRDMGMRAQRLAGPDLWVYPEPKRINVIRAPILRVVRSRIVAPAWAERIKLVACYGLIAWPSALLSMLTRRYAPVTATCCLTPGVVVCAIAEPPPNILGWRAAISLRPSLSHNNISASGQRTADTSLSSTLTRSTILEPEIAMINTTPDVTETGRAHMSDQPVTAPKQSCRET